MLKQFYNDAILIKLFVTDGKKYWSERVLRNKKEFEKKRKLKSEAGKKGMAVRWNSNNNVITEHNNVITEDNKGKESKVKEIKVKEIKANKIKEEDIHVIIDGLILTKEEYQKLCDKFGKAATDNKLEDMKNCKGLSKKYVSLYRTAYNWLERDKQRNQPDLPLTKKYAQL
jgi:hypothetical protein